MGARGAAVRGVLAMGLMKGGLRVFESTTSIRIAKPEERVYEYRADLARHAE
jgi:hypothetical protein